MEKQVTDKDAVRSGRRAYARPVLRDFGKVGQLTQSGTDLRPEPGSGNNPNRNRT